MHDCQKYREDWVAGTAEAIHSCEACRSFCEEAAAILQATETAAAPVPELTEDYWPGYQERLREKLVRENAAQPSNVYRRLAPLAAAAAVAGVLTWGGLRVTQPIERSDVERSKAGLRIEFDADHIEGLDPMVVLFLGQSELFLRSFTKIQPSYVEDLDDARVRARRDLMEIAEQKALAGDFAPVRIALDEYEGVLREIKNLDSSEDLADIQQRIHRNGLIANLNAYQPHVTLVTQR